MYVYYKLRGRFASARFRWACQSYLVQSHACPNVDKITSEDALPIMRFTQSKQTLNKNIPPRTHTSTRTSRNTTPQHTTPHHITPYHTTTS